jgi:hypothetical protein
MRKGSKDRPVGRLQPEINPAVDAATTRPVERSA